MGVSHSLYKYDYFFLRRQVWRMLNIKFNVECVVKFHYVVLLLFLKEDN